MRTVTITKSWKIAEGEGKKGPWTLYGYEANDAEGTPIAYPLKSFTHLSGAVQVEVEVQNHEVHGTSYMLKPVGGKSNGGRGPGAGELAELRDRIARLESEVGRLSGLVDRRHPDDAAPPPRAAAGIPDDDDIPF